MWCLYIWGTIFTIICANLTRSDIFVSLFMSALRNSPLVLHILTSCLSCALTVDVVSTDSAETLGVVASPGTAFLSCLRTSAHVRPFTLMYLLTIKNIRYSSASHFCYLFSFLTDLRRNVYLMWIWDSYSVTVVSPFSPSSFSLRFREYYVNSYAITVA